MDRREFMQAGSTLMAGGLLKTRLAEPGARNVRQQWLDYLEKTASPVLTALSQRRLKKVMPVECKPGQEQSRRQCTYLEAMGRTLCGVAPWLETGSEGSLRVRYCGLAREAIAAGVDPASADYMPFGMIAQTLVDSAFLGLGMLRAPKELVEKLPGKVRQQLVDAFKKTRLIQPPVSNWLLFSAMVEATLAKLDADWEKAPVELALTKHKQWYAGDGVYGDGPQFHADYYDSFVIHPFLLAVLESPAGKVGVGPELLAVEGARARRYATIQERTIGRDGTWPVTGRSIAYRCGAFHLLADMALREQLPDAVTPAQVRGALTAAIEVCMGARDSYDVNGWLTIGLAGHQPSLGEPYISTGSLYLCLEAFVPLGLPADRPFWKDAAEDWTARKAWSGQNVTADHAMQEPKSSY